MLKGKTIIELTDVNTGKVERHEDGNMITNALNHIFEHLGHFKSSSKLFGSDFMPAYASILGGILFFDGVIPEDKKQLFAPAGVNLTACAVYGKQNDTIGTCRGNYNTTESEVNTTERYVKYVYDFTTSQGNGTIASVCLTGKLAGYCGYGSDANPAFTNSSSGTCYFPCDAPINLMKSSKGDPISVGSTQFLFLIDSENDIMYYVRVNSAKSVSIIKKKGFFKSVSVFDTPSKGGKIIETIDLPDFATGLLQSSNLYFNYNIEDGCLYLYSAYSQVSVGGTFSIIKINCSDWSVREYSMTNQANETISIDTTSYVYGEYFYCRQISKCEKLFKIKVGNSTDITALNIPLSCQGGRLYPSFVAEGRIWYEPYSHSYMDEDERCFVVNTDTNELKATENRYVFGNLMSNYYPTTIPILGHKECVYWRGYFMYPSFYLATINNLDSPVTKTADKTMKVTYIIQEHDS